MRHPFKNFLNPSDEILALLDSKTLQIIECNRSFENFILLKKGHVIAKSFYAVTKTKNHKKETDTALNEIEKNGFYAGHISDGAQEVFFHLITSNNKTFVRCRISKIDNWQDRFETLIENNISGLFKADLQGSIVSCNKAFAEILGYTNSGELIGKKIQNYYSEKITWRKHLNNLLKSKKGLLKYDISFKGAKGQIIECISCTYLQRDNSGLQTLIGTVEEITTQKRLQKELAESEERFQSLTSVSRESVVFIHNKVIVDANNQFAKLFGYYETNDVLGKKISEFIDSRETQRITSTLELKSPNMIELRATTRASQTLFLEATGRHIHRAGVKCIGLLLNDITARKRAHNQMVQSVLRLRNLLENSPNGICIITEGKIKYINHAATALFGYEEEDELYEKSFLNFVTSQFKASVLEDFKKIRNGQDVEYREIKLIDKQKLIIDVGLMNTLTIYDNKPSIQVSINNISTRVQLAQEQMRVRLIEEINTVLKQEIDEHKRTQEKLIQAQKFSRNIIESSIDMIIATDDRDGITEFNIAAQKKFGYSLSEIKNKKTDILYEDPKEFRTIRAALAIGNSYSGEIVNRKKNGEIFTTLLSASTIKNDKGEVVGSMGVSRDITEYKENEQKAREQTAKLEAIYNSTENMMLWTLDSRFYITTMNKNFSTWMLESHGAETLLGIDFLEIIKRRTDPDLYQGQLDAFANAFNGRPQQFELPLRNIQGKTEWLQVFLNPILLRDKPEEISCLVYDITDRKEMDRRILGALKEKEVLLQEIHHRVKNNLQVISSILSLQSSFVTDEKILELLGESQNRIKSMSFIHETLYRTADFSSIEFSEYIRVLVNNLFQSYRTQSAGVQLKLNIQNIFLSIDAAIPCGLIINELVSNALKYAFLGRDSGKMLISIKEKSNKVMLLVQDDGVGLPKDFLYERSESLGIQLVYTLVEQLDGTIQIESKKGTSFLITFEKH